jgi:hypothetical protein
MLRRTTLLSCSIVAAGVVLAACGGANAPKYANDGDTGAAAPATQQTLSPNPTMGDSTMGVARGTGAPAAAGDTMGATGKAAGLPDSTRGQPRTGAPRP